MRIKCNSFEEMKFDIVSGNKSIVMFGSGVIGCISALQILKDLGIADRIECYVDNDLSKQGELICIGPNNVSIKSPDYLKDCSNNTTILINISRYAEVIQQLETIENTQNMDCYLMGMMCIHNFCLGESNGKPQLTDKIMIPKRIHYMWLGGKTIPDNLKKCMDTWKKHCPDYEIVEWNEENYDIGKHPYMKQAYECGAYGFVPDYARLDILYNEGGIYLDTDVEIRRSIDDLLYQEAFCGVEKWQVLNFGGMSGSIKGHPMIKEFLDARADILFCDETGRQNRNTCGFYDTQVALNNGYQINGKTQCIQGMNIYSFDYFHPYDYMSGDLNVTSNTYSVHWFNGGWMDDDMKKANENTRKEYSMYYHNAIMT